MFTGIIEELGVVKQIEGPRPAKDTRAAGQSVQVTILAETVLENVKIGDSLTVNGVCLTVVAFSDSEITVEISPESLGVTSLGALKVGDGVNLERALRLSDRLGGHLVTGHVDGVGRIRERRQQGDTYVLCIEAPQEVLRYCVKKGSIAVDGISLTINDLTERDFSVAIIPHTAKMTTIGLKGVGDGVNLEVDLIGKYIERFLCHEEVKPSGKRIGIEYLKKHKLL